MTERPIDLERVRAVRARLAALALEHPDAFRDEQQVVEAVAGLAATPAEAEAVLVALEEERVRFAAPPLPSEAVDRLDDDGDKET